MTQPLLAIENLSVGFRQQETVRTVVNTLSLRVDAGQTLALVGESGSGKSVTALSILRLLPSLPRFILPVIFVSMVNHCFTPTSRRFAAYEGTKSP